MPGCVCWHVLQATRDMVAVYAYGLRGNYSPSSTPGSWSPPAPLCAKGGGYLGKALHWASLTAPDFLVLGNVNPVLTRLVVPIHADKKYNAGRTTATSELRADRDVTPTLKMSKEKRTETSLPLCHQLLERVFVVIFGNCTNIAVEWWCREPLGQSVSLFPSIPVNSER